MRLIFPGINGPTVPLNRRRTKKALKILIKIRKNLIITISTFRNVMHYKVIKMSVLAGKRTMNELLEVMTKNGMKKRKLVPLDLCYWP